MKFLIIALSILISPSALAVNSKGAEIGNGSPQMMAVCPDDISACYYEIEVFLNDVYGYTEAAKSSVAPPKSSVIVKEALLSGLSNVRFALLKNSDGPRSRMFVEISWMLQFYSKFVSSCTTLGESFTACIEEENNRLIETLNDFYRFLFERIIPYDLENGLMASLSECPTTKELKRYAQETTDLLRAKIGWTLKQVERLSPLNYTQIQRLLLEQVSHSHVSKDFIYFEYAKKHLEQKLKSASNEDLVESIEQMNDFLSEVMADLFSNDLEVKINCLPTN